MPDELDDILKSYHAPTGKLGATDYADALRQAGWDEKDIPIMTAIGQAESTGNPRAFNPGIGAGGRPTKEKSVGLWQVNTLAHPQYDKEKLNDPVYNAKAALDIFKKQGLKAWGAYTDGRYKKYYKGVPQDNLDNALDQYKGSDDDLDSVLGDYKGTQTPPTNPTNQPYQPVANAAEIPEELPMQFQQSEELPMQFQQDAVPQAVPQSRKDFISNFKFPETKDISPGTGRIVPQLGNTKAINAYRKGVDQYAQARQTQQPEQQAQQQPQTPQGGRYANTTVEFNVNDRPQNLTPRQYVNRKIAETIASKYDVPFDIAQQVVESEPYTQQNQSVDTSYFDQLAKNGGTGQTQVGGSIIRKAVEAGQQYKERKAQSDALLAQWGNKWDSSPVAQQIQANIYSGNAGSQAGTQLLRENEAYTDWLKRTGYDNEEYRNSHQQEFKQDVANALTQFGSFNALQDAAKEKVPGLADHPFGVIGQAAGLLNYDRAQSASDLYNHLRLTDQEYASAKNLGESVKASEMTAPTGSFGSQFATTLVSDFAKMTAGAMRITDNIPLVALAKWSVGADKILTADDLDKFAKKTEIVGQTAQGDGVIAKVTGVAGQAFGGLPGLAVATVTAGGNPIIGFGLHSLLTNTDKPIAQQIRSISTDTALGAAFSGIGAIGRFAGTKAANKFLTPEVLKALDSPEAEKNFVSSIISKGQKIQTLAEQGVTEGERAAAQSTLDKYLEKYGLVIDDLKGTAQPGMNPVLKAAMRKAEIAKTLAEKGTSIGLVAGTGYATSRLQGQSQEESVKNALLWGAMEAVMGIRGKKPGDVWTADDIAAANERVVRVPDAKGKPRDILLLDSNGKLQGVDVTGKVPSGVVDGQILPKPGEKTIQPINDKTPEERANDFANGKNPGIPPQPAQVGTEALVQDQPVESTNTSIKAQEGKTSPQSSGVASTNAVPPVSTERAQGLQFEAPLRPSTMEGAKARIGELEEQRDSAHREVNTDPLTGMANKRALMQISPEGKEIPDKKYIIWDVNGFKKVNDELGHDEGDELLKGEVKDAIRQAAQETDPHSFVSRPGGDEFVGITHKDKAEQVAQRASEIFGVKTFKDKNGNPFQVSLTGTTGTTLKEADDQLTEAKTKAKIAHAEKAGLVATDREGKPLQKESNKKSEQTRQPPVPSKEALPANKSKGFTESETINKGYASLKNKLGEKGAQKYFRNVDKLINPNENTIVQYRPNGVVTKEGDKYTFHALADMDMKQWRVGFKSDVTDQFVTKQKEADGYVKNRPVKILNEQGNKVKVQFLDGKKETPTVLKTAVQEKAAKSFPDFLKERIGDNWYVSDRPVKSQEAKGATRIKKSDYARLQKEFESEKADQTEVAGFQRPLSPTESTSASTSKARGEADKSITDNGLKKAADPESVEYLTETLPKAHSQDLYEHGTASIDSNGHLNLNEEAGETLRRLWGTVFPNDSGVSFYAATHDRNQLKKLVVGANKAIKRYKDELGYTEDNLKGLIEVKNGLEALSKGDYGISYVFEDSLPHEEFHVEDLRAGRTTKSAIEKIKKSKFWNDPKFNRMYPGISDADKVSEMVAILHTDPEFFKGTPAEKKSILNAWADGIIEKHTDDQGKIRIDLNKFQRVAQYASEKSSEGSEVPDRESTEGSAGEPDVGEGDKERAGSKPAGDQRSSVRTPETFTPQGKEKLSQTPKSLREKADIPIEDRTYQSVTNADQQAFADKILDKGLDDAQKWFKDQIDDQNGNNGATTVVGLNLINALAKKGRIKEMNKVADGLVPFVTSAAQSVQAMSIVSMFDPERAVPYAVKISKQATGKDLTPTQVERATDIAKRFSETAQTEGIGEVLQKQLENHIKELEREKQSLADAKKLAEDDKKKLTLNLEKAKKTIADLRKRVEKNPRVANKALVKEIESRKDEIMARIHQAFGAGLRQAAWHGSPHIFDKFDISKIGTGEGAQAYGHGLYFTDKEEVADHYKDALTKRTIPNSLTDYVNAIRVGEKKASDYKISFDRALADAAAERDKEKVLSISKYELSKWDGLTKTDAYPYKDYAKEQAEHYRQFIADVTKHGISLATSGAKYKVDLKPKEDEYLLWDKPLSEQSEKVRKALVTIEADYREAKPTPENGNAIYQFVTRLKDGAIRHEDGSYDYDDPQKVASDYLHSLGIRGIKYLDGSSRSTKITDLEKVVKEANGYIAQYKKDGNAERLAVWEKRLASAKAELASVNYNYVIFDDKDVEITDILRHAHGDIPEDALIDWSILNLADNMGKKSVGEFKNELNELTNGQLTEDEINSIHAEAVSQLTSTHPRTQSQIVASKTRNAHLREAKRYKAKKEIEPYIKNLGTEPSKLVTNIINEGLKGGYTDEAMWFALARKTLPNHTDALKALAEQYPESSFEDKKRIMKDADAIFNKAKDAIKESQIANQYGKNLTEKDIENIKEERRVNQSEARKVQNEANKFYGGLATPTSRVVADTVVNIRRANLLTGIKTHLRNIVGNTVNAITEETARPLSWLADVAASGVTGERTVDFLNPKAVAKSFHSLVGDDVLKSVGRESGIKHAMEILRHGDSLANKEEQQHLDNMIGEKFPKMKWMDTYVNGVFRTMGAEDALYKTYAFERSLIEQAKTQAITEHRRDKTVDIKNRTRELLQRPTEVMIHTADDWASFATFNNDNALSGAIAKFKKLHPAIKFGVETLMPYDRTPTNIILRVIEHTPAGFIMAAKKLFNREPTKKFRNRYHGAVKADLGIEGKPTKEQLEAIDQSLRKIFTRQQQADFAKTFGRAGLGSSLFALGFFLAAGGLLAGSMQPEDEDKKETNEYFDRMKKGVENRSLRLPGVGRFVLSDDPAMKVLTSGATFYEQMQMFKGDTPSAVWHAGVETTKDIVGNQPLANSLGSVYQLFNKGKYGEFTGNILGGYVPTMVSDIGEVGDEKARTASGYQKGQKRNNIDEELNFQMRGFKNSFLKRVPVARNYYVDESQSTVPQEERGGALRRAVRAIDLFNTRSDVPYKVKGQPSPEEFMASPEYKHADTDTLVDIIKMDRDRGLDTSKLELGLKKKALSAWKGKTLKPDEVERIKTVLPDFNLKPRTRK